MNSQVATANKTSQAGPSARRTIEADSLSCILPQYLVASSLQATITLIALNVPTGHWLIPFVIRKSIGFKQGLLESLFKLRPVRTSIKPEVSL